MEWKINDINTRPPCQVPCVIRTKDGRELNAMLIHLNGKYHSKVSKDKLYKWRLGKHKYIEDDDVVKWRYAIDI